jgi:hypothetical protein
MTSETLFDALETCLQALDQGEAVEACLARYPALADELRPILIAALQAREAAAPEVPAGVAQRGKARLLQAAAEMRARQTTVSAPSVDRKKGFFGARFYRLAVTASLMIAFLLTGGTGLVNASNGALPGDQLYPVKRGWEGLQLALIFDPKAKVEREREFEHERVQEIEELYSEKRIEQINFQGLVQSQNDRAWVIGGLSILIEDETVFQGEATLGALVQVLGETDDGRIKAEKIILITGPSATPSLLSTPAVAPVLQSPATTEPDEQKKKDTSDAGGSSEKDQDETEAQGD